MSGVCSAGTMVHSHRKIFSQSQDLRLRGWGQSLMHSFQGTVLTTLPRKPFRDESLPAVCAWACSEDGVIHGHSVAKGNHTWPLTTQNLLGWSSSPSPVKPVTLYSCWLPSLHSSEVVPKNTI